MNDESKALADKISKSYAAIDVTELKDNRTFPHRPEPLIIAHLDDPALSVMTDFNQVTPSTIYADVPIDSALTQMRVLGEHVLLVIDQQDTVLGLISSGDIQGAKPVKIIQTRQIKRNDVLVRMVMTPQAEVTALTLDAVRHAKVGNIVTTLKDRKHHYALVVANAEITDNDENFQSICGLFSLSKIGNLLGLDVASLFPEAHSLAELQHLHS